jgi:hypothetical protein
MPPKPRIRLYCSVTGAALRRETEVNRLGREQNCVCHGKQIMARCVSCGLVKYHDCSAHAKRSGHHIVQLDDPHEHNTAMPEVSLFCFMIDQCNQQYLFSKPCPFVAIDKKSHNQNQVKEGDVLLLAKHDMITHVTRLMEREPENDCLSMLQEDTYDCVCYYVQIPTELPETKTMEDAVHKWSSVKNAYNGSEVVQAKKKLLIEALDECE